jgi:hypothetical protein
LLNQSPDFRAAAGDFLCYFRSADHERCVLGEQTHYATEANVGRLMRRSRRISDRRVASTFSGYADAEIMRVSDANNKHIGNHKGHGEHEA